MQLTKEFIIKKETATSGITELLKLFSTEHKSILWLEKTFGEQGKPVCTKCNSTKRIRDYKRLKKGRGSVGKTTVFGMHEHKGKLKAMPVSNTTKQTRHPIIRDNIAASTIYTDDNPLYTGTHRRHKVVKHSAKQYVNGMAHTNGI